MVLVTLFVFFSANRISVLVSLTLMTLQSFRRGYETWFVSVFSDVKINITQYIVGYTHYWGTITCILAEAEGFKKSSKSFDF